MDWLTPQHSLLLTSTVTMKNKCDWNINVFVSSRAALSLKMYEHSLDQCSVSSQQPLWFLVHRSRQQRGVHQNSQADQSMVCNNVWLQSWNKEDTSSISLPPQGRGIQCLLSTIQTRNRGTATTEGVGAGLYATLPKKPFYPSILLQEIWKQDFLWQ